MILSFTVHISNLQMKNKHYILEKAAYLRYKKDKKLNISCFSFVS